MKCTLITQSAFALLPPELWIKIAMELPIVDYFQLVFVNKQIASLLLDAHVQKQWLLYNMHFNYSNALMIAFRHRLFPIVRALLVGPSPCYGRTKLEVFSNAFLQIACHEAGAAQNEKLHVIRSLLDDDSGRMKDSPKATDTSLSFREHILLALRWSCHYAETGIVCYLLEQFGQKGCEIRCSSTWWLKMLRERRFQLARALLIHGAKVTMAEDDSDELALNAVMVSLKDDNTSEEEQTTLRPEHYVLRTLAFEGLSEAVQFLLDETPEYQRNRQTFSHALSEVIYSAALYNQHHLLQDVMKRYSLSLSEVDPNGNTFWCAAGQGNLELLRYLTAQMQTQKPIYECLSNDLIVRCILQCISNHNLPVLEFLLSEIIPGSNVDPREESLNLYRVACKVNNKQAADKLFQAGFYLTRDEIRQLMALVLTSGTVGVASYLSPNHSDVDA